MAVREPSMALRAGVFGDSRDVLDREVDLAKAVHSPTGQVIVASTRSIGDPRDIEKLADILSMQSGRRPVRTAGWTRAQVQNEAITRAARPDIPSILNGASRDGCCRRANPHHVDRTPPQAFRERGCAGDRRHAISTSHGYGKRISNGTEA